MARFNEEELAQLQKRNKAAASKVPDGPAIIKPRAVGQRGKCKIGTEGKQPIDDGKGKYVRCQDCGNDYNSVTNRRRYTVMEHGVGYDHFVCECGHKFDRFK